MQDLTADTGVAAPDSSIVAALEHAASANEDSLLAVAEAAVHAAFTEDKVRLLFCWSENEISSSIAFNF